MARTVHMVAVAVVEKKNTYVNQTMAKKCSQCLV